MLHHLFIDFKLIYILDLMGTIAFAISGAMAASKKRVDLFGAIFAGLITAVGGGTIRDILIGYFPVMWIQNLTYIYVGLIGAIATFLLPKFFFKWKGTVTFFDAIGLGTFTVIGLTKTISLGFHPVVGILMGVVTGVMGGILRDAFVGNTPLLLRREIYAVASLIGGILYTLFDSFGLDDEWNQVIVILIVFFIRFISYLKSYSLPRMRFFE
ncbi:MAG: trimeric intracellular cation channel family protein [Hyphomicrobiales bacterium]